MTEATLSIGEVAERAGVNASAIRFYERRGLLPEPERVGGHRRYTGATVRRLEIIAAGRSGVAFRWMRLEACWLRATRACPSVSGCARWRAPSCPRPML